MGLELLDRSLLFSVILLKFRAKAVVQLLGSVRRLLMQMCFAGSCVI